MRLGKYLSSLTKPELEEIKKNCNLTDDESVIFDLLAKRRSITEISMKLSVCDRTINRRIADIYYKVSKAGGIYGEIDIERKRDKSR